jgi:hypothetical protein
MGDSFNKYIIKRINENNGNCGSLYMPGSAFVGTWRDNPNIYSVQNSVEASPILQESMQGQIDITEVIEDAFYRIHIRRGYDDVNAKWTYEFHSTMMYNDGIITGQMDVNNYSIFYFDINRRLVQQFQQLNVNSETEILYAKSYLTKVAD